MTRRRAETIAVLGAGSWGTALAVHLGRAGHDVRLWARDAALVGAIHHHRINPRYLTEITIPEHVVATTDAAAALAGVRTVVVAVPSHVVRAVVRSLRRVRSRGTPCWSARRRASRPSRCSACPR